MASGTSSRPLRSEYVSKLSIYYDRLGDDHGGNLRCRLCTAELSKSQFYRHIEMCKEKYELARTTDPAIATPGFNPSNLGEAFETAALQPRLESPIDQAEQVEQQAATAVPGQEYQDEQELQEQPVACGVYSAHDQQDPPPHGGAPDRPLRFLLGRLAPSVAAGVTNLFRSAFWGTRSREEEAAAVAIGEAPPPPAWEEPEVTVEAEPDYEEMEEASCTHLNSCPGHQQAEQSAVLCTFYYEMQQREIYRPITHSTQEANNGINSSPELLLYRLVGATQMRKAQTRRSLTPTSFLTLTKTTGQRRQNPTQIMMQWTCNQALHWHLPLSQHPHQMGKHWFGCSPLSRASEYMRRSMKLTHEALARMQAVVVEPLLLSAAGVIQHTHGGVHRIHRLAHGFEYCWLDTCRDRGPPCRWRGAKRGLSRMAAAAALRTNLHPTRNGGTIDYHRASVLCAGAG